MAMYRAMYRMCMTVVVCGGFLAGTMFGVEGECEVVGPVAAQSVMQAGAEQDLEPAAAQLIVAEPEIGQKSAEQNRVIKRMSDMSKEEYLKCMKEHISVPESGREFAAIFETLKKRTRQDDCRYVDADGKETVGRLFILTPELLKEVCGTLVDAQKAAGISATYAELMSSAYFDMSWQRDDIDRRLEQSVERHGQELLTQKQEHEQHVQKVLRDALLQQVQDTARLHRKQRETQERMRAREAELVGALDRTGRQMAEWRDDIGQWKEMVTQLEQEKQALSVTQQNQIEELQQRCAQYEQERERELEERRAREQWLMIGSEMEQ